MDAMPALRAIVSPLLGYDWIDLDEATRRRIPVVNAEIPESRQSMAEATIMLVLALLVPPAGHRGAASFRRGTRPAPQDAEGTDARYRRLRRNLSRDHPATRAVATQAARAHAGCASRGENVEFVSLEHLLHASDIVLLMTRLNERNRHLLDRRLLQSMKPGVLLVNTARAVLVDEAPWWRRWSRVMSARPHSMSSRLNRFRKITRCGACPTSF
jgi:phosphoglycerate dehydrogenase-like enzyme